MISSSKVFAVGHILHRRSARRPSFLIGFVWWVSVLLTLYSSKLSFYLSVVQRDLNPSKIYTELLILKTANTTNNAGVPETGCKENSPGKEEVASSATNQQATNATQQPSRRHFQRYHEVASQIRDLVAHYPRAVSENSYSAYTRARTVKSAPWLPRRRMCKETCCVSTVAISLDQDDHQLINTQDGEDLADVAFLHYKASAHLVYHRTTFREEMIPCLLPGTIIHLQNHRKVLNYFWDMIRPKLVHPYLMTTSGSDGDSPASGNEFIQRDPLLIRWYGTNPLNPPLKKGEERPDEEEAKFRPLSLGLSYQHPQEKYILPYMKINNYTNPFVDKSRWTSIDWNNFNFRKDVFVHFGLRRPHRKYLWPILCPNNTQVDDENPTPDGRHNSASCHQETNTLPVEQIYTDMSMSKFGVSPPGAGWDCYRTYELILMGVIPVIEERIPESHYLFKDLPVIHFKDFNNITTQQELIDTLHQYVTSEDFLNNDFQKGWERMFLRYRRRQFLQETGRDKEILFDEHGREYYQAYHYEYFGPNATSESIYCSEQGNCETPIDRNYDPPWMNSSEVMKRLSESDNSFFMSVWKSKGQQLVQL